MATRIQGPGHWQASERSTIPYARIRSARDGMDCLAQGQTDLGMRGMHDDLALKQLGELRAFARRAIIEFGVQRQ